MKELHLHAAKAVMSELEPPFETDNPKENLVQWLNSFHLCLNTINPIFSSYSDCCLVQDLR